MQEVLNVRQNEQIRRGAEVAQDKFVERIKQNVNVTAVVFRTAYECAQSHLSFREYERCSQLMTLFCGEMLHSHHACANIVKHIACCMRKEIVSHIVNNVKAQFSLMIDESTSVSNVQSLIVYVRVIFDDTVCTYFLGLLALTVASAAEIFTKLTGFLTECGLTESILTEQLVGLCTDGASCMVGQFSGVAKLLKKNVLCCSRFTAWRTDLSWRPKMLLTSVTEASRFRFFVDEWYKTYSMSPKNQAKLQCIAEALAIQLMKVHKVFDVRWVFLSFVAVRAVLRDYPALCKHFSVLSEQARSSRESSKFKGLINKL